jgi:hypothetical protein
VSDRSHARAMIEAQDGTAASAQASGSPLKDVTGNKSEIEDSCHEGTQARAQEGHSFPTPLTPPGKIGHVSYRHVCNLKPVAGSRDQGGEASSRGGKRARSLTLTTGYLIQLGAVTCCS